MAGKNDWIAFDLPSEGEGRLLRDSIVRELPTCREAERLVDVRDRMDASPLPGLAVVNELHVVMGFLPAGLPEAATEVPVGAVMVEGPTTVRLVEDADVLAHRMEHAGVTAVLATLPDGVLAGAFLRDAAAG